MNAHIYIGVTWIFATLATIATKHTDNIGRVAVILAAAAWLTYVGHTLERRTCDHKDACNHA